MKVSKKLIGLIILVLIVVVGLIIANKPSNTEEDVARILKDGRLYSLPKSASNVKTEGMGGLFTGEGFLSFQATREDIEIFVSNSPSIKNVKPESFNESHMYLAYPEDDNFEEKHKYFYKHKHWPKWYDPTIKNEGRLYEIPPIEGHNWGSVIIDFGTNTVLVYVIWS
jgi:hypothetical protein